MNGLAGSAASLYGRALGAAFLRLPQSLQRFHAAGSGKAAGTIRVERGRGFVRYAIAELMRLPAADSCATMRLEIAAVGDREVWTRDFGSRRLVTTQWLADGLLVEQAGPLRFAFQLDVDGDALRFTQRRAWLAGVPLPKRVSPQVCAVATGLPIGWRIDVRVSAPLVGEIVRYVGEVVPEC